MSELMQHPAFVIYVLGVIAWWILLVFKMLVLGSIRWLTKEAIFQANYAKICDPPEPVNWAFKAAYYVICWVIESLLSWAAVIYEAGHLLWVLAKQVRELFVTVPENIKRLRFPLWNYPDLKVEAVWAHVYALGIVAGIDIEAAKRMGIPTGKKGALIWSLDDITDLHPDFNQAAALSYLDGLAVLPSRTIAKAVKHYSEKPALKLASGGE
jgi:hypothetical protein